MRSSFIFFSVLALNGCLLRTNTSSSETLTTSEASEALDESSVSAQASELTSASIDIATNFTFGEAAEQAALDLKTFIVTELPCANITVSGPTLTVDYGAKPGACIYNGHTFSGEVALTIFVPGDGTVEVDHTWTNFTNGVVSVSGTAEVTWDAVHPSRHVTSDLNWTRVWDGRTGEGSADVTQTPLTGGVVVGFQEDGSRTWTGQTGFWSLDINAVQVRWADPVPQSGSYVLTTPDLKTATLAFARANDTTIAVTMTSGKSSFTFDVTETGQAQ
jgi:hypothetical protein